MNKETKILLAILIPMFALLFLFGGGKEKPENAISVVVEGGIMCETRMPVARIRNAVEEKALVRTAMTAECKRAFMDIPYELVEKDGSVLKVRDMSVGGRIMYTRSKDVAYRKK